LQGAQGLAPCGAFCFVCRDDPMADSQTRLKPRLTHSRGMALYLCACALMEK
jgi:hypothetical protein